MKKQKKEDVQKPQKIKTAHLQWWIHSFTKLDKSFAMTLLFDAAYVLALVGWFILFLALLRFAALPLAVALQSFISVYLKLSMSNGATNPAIDTTLSQSLFLFKSSMIKVAMVIIAGIAGLFAVTTAYKACIWMHLKNVQMTLPYFKKFFWLNISWQLLWFIIASIIFLGFEVRAAVVLLFLVLFSYMYFTPFFRLLLTEKHTWKELYKETFIIGAKKLRHFIVLIGVAPITVFIGAIIVTITINLIAPLAMGVTMLLFLLLTLTWVRFYFYMIAKNLL